MTQDTNTPGKQDPDSATQTQAAADQHPYHDRNKNTFYGVDVFHPIGVKLDRKKLAQLLKDHTGQPSERKASDHIKSNGFNYVVLEQIKGRIQVNHSGFIPGAEETT